MTIMKDKKKEHKGREVAIGRYLREEGWKMIPSMRGMETKGRRNPDRSLRDRGWGRWYPEKRGVETRGDGIQGTESGRNRIQMGEEWRLGEFGEERARDWGR